MTCPLVLLIFLVVSFAMGTPSGETDYSGVIDSGVRMGIIDLDDLPITGLSPQQALDLLFHRYRAQMRLKHENEMRLRTGKAISFPMETVSEKTVREVCGTSASLECGRKVLQHNRLGRGSTVLLTEKLLASSPAFNATLQRKCGLRKYFVSCIEELKDRCGKKAQETKKLPKLPPQSVVRTTQSKIWRALWASGGCLLAID